MTASEKLTELIENDKLTDKQQDDLAYWNIEQVSKIRSYLSDRIKGLQNETGSSKYSETIIALYNLLDYNDDDFVIYDEDGVTELDFDTLNDALAVD